MRSPNSPPSPPSVSFADRTLATSRADDPPWDSDGHLLIASSPAETAPPPCDVKKPRSFFTAKSRALAGRLNAPPIQERGLMPPRTHEGALSPVRRSKPQLKEFFDRQQAAAARRRAPPAVSETPKTTSTFRSFLERQRDSSKRRQEEPTASRDPKPSVSPRHAAIAPKAPQAPPIYSVRRAEMISEAVQRARSKIDSEVKKPYTYKPVLAGSSKEAMDEVKTRTEAILRKASEKRQRMYDEITSARAKAEKEAEDERRASKRRKARARRPAWLAASEKLMANFYKRTARQQAKDGVPEDVEPDHRDADVDLDPNASDDK